MKKISFNEYFGIKYVIISSTKEKIEKYLKKEFKHEIDMVSDALCTVLYDKRTIIISIKKEHEMNIPLFTHEAYHAVNFTCDIISSDTTGSEFECYLIQHLMIKYLTEILKVDYKNFKNNFQGF